MRCTRWFNYATRRRYGGPQALRVRTQNFLINTLNSWGRRQKNEWFTGVKAASCQHDTTATSSSGTAGSHRRPSTRRKIRPQKFLPCLQILGPACPKAPLRQSHLQDRSTPAIMEDDISGFFHLSRALHQRSGGLVP